MIEYNLVHSRRRTIGIYITRDAAVEVRAPYGVSKKAIERFVAEKQDWIKRSLGRVSKINEIARTYDLSDGILFLGRKYSLSRDENIKKGRLTEEALVLPKESDLVNWYKEQAKSFLPKRTGELAELHSFQYASVKINSAKTRWGSCSSKKNINYSWRIMLFEKDLIDYVIIHELAHTKELNHSPRFWKTVQDALPNYAERRRRIKTLQRSPEVMFFD